MKIKMGCDIVQISKFKLSIDRTGSDFLDQVFFEEELSMAKSIQSLAGYFSLKESVIKALSLSPGSWHKIKIIKHVDGRPDIFLINFDHKFITYAVSISHDGDYVFSSAVFIL